MDTWHDALGGEKQQPYFQEILNAVRQERLSGQIIYPPAADVFNAFRLTAFDRVKAVILGQDPYHGAGQAHGLAFSVRQGIRIPPSLLNIYKELETDIEGFSIPAHALLGWERFTDTVIRQLATHRKHLVFMLWGGYAQQKGRLIDSQNHLILTAPHPSPLSAYRGFFGCRHFSQANSYLSRHGIDPINWKL
ncbi:TPA: uracil-DNA glycosylase [Neisseria meningitidis]